MDAIQRQKTLSLKKTNSVKMPHYSKMFQGRLTVKITTASVIRPNLEYLFVLVCENVLL